MSLPNGAMKQADLDGALAPPPASPPPAATPPGDGPGGVDVDGLVESAMMATVKATIEKMIANGWQPPAAQVAAAPAPAASVQHAKAPRVDGYGQILPPNVSWDAKSWRWCVDVSFASGSGRFRPRIDPEWFGDPADGLEDAKRVVRFAETGNIALLAQMHRYTMAECLVKLRALLV